MSVPVSAHDYRRYAVIVPHASPMLYADYATAESVAKGHARTMPGCDVCVYALVSTVRAEATEPVVTPVVSPSL